MYITCKWRPTGKAKFPLGGPAGESGMKELGFGLDLENGEDVRLAGRREDTVGRRITS